MPKRSNEFQRLVRVIYEQLASSGATVTESALTKERGSEVEREIDVLVEQSLVDVTIRLAVECRDRSRLADVEWIDQLIGKYRDLPIDRVIAVSRTGFTETAREKASANRIDTRSLSDALTSDWPTELETLTLGRFTIKAHVTGWGLITEPPWEGDEPLVICVGDETLQAKELINLLQRQFLGHAVDVVLKRSRTTADFTKPWTQPVRLQPPAEPEVDAVRKDGFRVKVKAVDLHFEGSGELAPISVNRQLYGSVGITSGTIHAPELQRAFKVTVVQAPGKNPARPIIESLPEADRTYST